MVIASDSRSWPWEILIISSWDPWLLVYINPNANVDISINVANFLKINIRTYNAEFQGVSFEWGVGFRMLYLRFSCQFVYNVISGFMWAEGGLILSVTPRLLDCFVHQTMKLLWDAYGTFPCANQFSKNNYMTKLWLPFHLAICVMLS